MTLSNEALLLSSSPLFKDIALNRLTILSENTDESSSDTALPLDVLDFREDAEAAMCRGYARPIGG